MLSNLERTQVAAYEAERADEAAWQARHVVPLAPLHECLDGADFAQAANRRVSLLCTSWP